MKAFHAYDIRGIYNEDFNKDDAYRIGFYLPKLLKTKKILIGRDVRISSPEIHSFLVKGLLDAGVEIFDAGLATTPMIYFLTGKYGFDGSLMITASHNGKAYNGMKISGKNASPIGYDKGLNKLEKMIEVEPTITEVQGKLISFDKKSEYIDFLKPYLPKGLENIKLSVDCSNGMAALLIKDILGNHPNYLYDTLDGSFPNHEANPLVPENVVDLKAAVLDKNSDIGIIFDGDADRVMFVDEKGNFISPDLMIALMGHYFAKQKSSSPVVVLQDIRTSKAVEEYLQSIMEVEMHTWRVGRAFAAPKLKEIGGLFGGELAGHYYFKEFFNSDSGLLAMLIILNVIVDFKKKGVTLSELIGEIPYYANSGELNFKLNQKLEAMDAVKAEFEKQEMTAFYDFDGYRLEFSDWWLNIRPSNTEPYLRLIVEARSQELLKEKTSRIKTIISSFN